MFGQLWRAARGRVVGRKNGWIMGGLVGAWLVLVGGGTMSMVIYDSTGGTRASAPARWPSGTTLTPAASRPTLVLFLHPRCPCGKATLAEFEALAGDAPQATKYVVFFEPEGANGEWVNTELVRRAASISGVQVIHDARGVEALVFGAVTSGEVLAYDTSEKLVFEGGLTIGRGVEGQGRARRALSAALYGHRTSVAGSAVYGCAIFDSAPVCAATAEATH